MTTKTKELLAQLEKELDELPTEEQEKLGELLLDELRRRKRQKNAEDVEPYASFHVLKNARFSGEADESTTYERTLYGLDEDDE